MWQWRLTEDSEPAYSIRSQATHPRRSAADRGEYRQAAGFVDRLLKPWPRSRSHFTKITARNFRKNGRFGISAHHERSRGLESRRLVFNVPCIERGRSRNFLNLARSCCSTKTCARVDLSLNFGLAAKAPKRDGCHRCHYPNLANTNYVSMGR